MLIKEKVHFAPSQKKLESYTRAANDNEENEENDN